MASTQFAKPVFSDLHIPESLLESPSFQGRNTEFSMWLKGCNEDASIYKFTQLDVDMV